LGGTKTAASRATVPSIPLLSAHLQMWRLKSLFMGQDDFVFPSVVRGGKIPRNGGMIVRDYLIPAAVRAGVIEEGERIGMHTLRQSLLLLDFRRGQSNHSTANVAPS